MAVYVPVVRKYHVGDHVGLEVIRAVGKVVSRRGVITGVGPDNGSGRYFVEFTGVPEQVHAELLVNFCRCNVHNKAWRKASKMGRDAVLRTLAEAMRDCESKFAGETSRIWYWSSDLLNCSGKERLPFNANVTYSTRPPYFNLAPMGTWDPSLEPRYKHGTGSA